MTATVGLRFTDGTTTVTISNGTTGYVLEYQPKNEPEHVEDVTEKSKTLLIGGLSTVRGNIESLNKLFAQARVYQLEKTGPVVYVERQLDTSDAWWRSELVEAAPIPGPDALDGDHINGKYTIQLVLTRKNWWEGAEAQVPLTNGNGTSNTSGLTVWNHDDAGSGHDNYVSIAAADVAGDLPGPARIEMTNTTSGKYIKWAWIGQNWTDPANFGHMLEAENASGGTNYADANCSGGYYSSIALASGAEADLFSWTLASAAQEASDGRWYKPLVRFRIGQSGEGMINDTLGSNLVSYRMKLKAGSVLVYTSTLAYKTGELAPIRIPPKLHTLTGLANLSVVLCGKQTTGSSKTIDVDFMHLEPLDGWRKIVMPYNYIANTYRLIDDAITGYTYGDTGAGSGKLGAQGVYGKAIHLQPGKLQRLYFLWAMDVLASHYITDTATLKVYYRPRRLTLN